jgi:hypothetical protein
MRESENPTINRPVRSPDSHGIHPVPRKLGELPRTRVQEWWETQTAKERCGVMLLVVQARCELRSTFFGLASFNDHRADIKQSGSPSALLFMQCTTAFCNEVKSIEMSSTSVYSPVVA